jgi:hypothetical protein
MFQIFSTCRAELLGLLLVKICWTIKELLQGKFFLKIPVDPQK